jgi:uncharacterized protein (TIGR02001 family)
MTTSNSRMKSKFWAAFAVAAATQAAFAMPTLADGMPKRSIKDAPVVEEKRDWTLTGNIGVTSEYVFRGISQTAENPAVQGGVDFTWKWFYAGIWSSNLDFGRDATPAGVGRPVAVAEVDFYAGIKPVFGKVTFDLGVIYYVYPGALDGAGQINAELDYVELKFGASGEIWKDATLGGTVFYSPEYTARQGDVWTFELAFAQVLPKIRDITPTFSALLGYQTGDDPGYFTAAGDDNYLYWNAGVTLGFGDRFSLDFRYWDTNISDTGGFCSGQLFQCDERFVASAKITY